MKRVVVTGIGAVTPIGCTTDVFWSNLLKGVSGIQSMKSLEDSSVPSKIGAVVTDFEFSIESDLIQRRLSRSVSFAIEASYQCMIDANIELTEEEEEHFGVCVGTGLGSPEDICKTWNLVKEDMLHSMVSGYISLEHKCRGPVISLNTACATGLHSVGEGFRRVKNGEASRMLVGGTESSMDEVTYSGFCRINALSTNFNESPELSSRPFDSERDGFVIGEGCGILMLEDLELALERGANIYAEVVGYGSTGDAYHVTQASPEGDGQVRAMKIALGEAGLTDLGDVDFVNAHATSTPLGDEIEYQALSSLLPSFSSSSLRVSSIKGSIGHLMGASGAVESIVSVLSIRDGVIPHNINYESSEFELLEDRIEIVRSPLEKEINYVLCNSFGFGGTNACVVFKSI